jgi:alpha-tubulin suppressor-like RCC1 family protein
VPVTVTGLSGATSITAGYLHTCALMADGTAQCWSNNGQGQLGNPTVTDYSNVPVTVTGLSDATAITAGYFHTCAWITAGTAKCWGYNDTGQLGDGTTTGSNVPVTVTGLL